MCWCSNSHVSAEMRQMSCLPYRSCRILALTWFAWRTGLIPPRMRESWWFPFFRLWLKLSVKISVCRQWRAESRKPVKENGMAALRLMATSWKRDNFSSMRKKQRQSAWFLTSMCIRIPAQTALQNTLQPTGFTKFKDKTEKIPYSMRRWSAGFWKIRYTAGKSPMADVERRRCMAPEMITGW